MEFDALGGIFSAKDVEYLKRLVNIIDGKQEEKPEPVPRIHKVIKCTTTCKVCGTTTVQWVLMVQTAKGQWEMEKSLQESDVDKARGFEKLSEKVTSCWNCMSYLISKEKEELAQMVLAAKAPLLARGQIMSRINAMNGSTRYKEKN